MNRVACLARLLVLAALPASGARAQTSGPVLYRLDPASGYAQGCYAPCLCPLAFTDDLLGTFTLEFQYSDPAYFDHYRVEAVNWVLSFGGEKRVTGSGEYVRGGQLALQQRLQLDLSTNGGVPQHYDSGLQAGDPSFPSFQLALSINGMYCYDQVFDLAVSPVPAGEVFPYTLKRSARVDGCFAPCTCPLTLARLYGSFGLVPLGPHSDPARQDYALVNESLWTTPLPSQHVLTGFGTYTLDLGAGQHRLAMDLSDTGNPPERYDSGFVAGGATFPWIDADAGTNGFVCDDHGFRFHARPR